MPSPEKKSVCILLPTLNEEKGIGTTIEGINKVSGGAWGILVVDSRSSDRTQEVARSMGAEVLDVPVRGKGRAVKEAFAKADSDLLVIMDADASYAPEDVPAILRALENADVALGSRFAGKIEGGAMSGVNMFGNRALTAFANMAHGKAGKGVTDVCTGMWGFTKKAYKSMEISAPHFELEANFLTEARRLGLPLAEVPISYRARVGEKKLSVLHGLDIALFLLRRRLS